MVRSLYLSLIFALVGQIQSSQLYTRAHEVQEGLNLDIGERVHCYKDKVILLQLDYEKSSKIPTEHIYTSNDI